MAKQWLAIVRGQRLANQSAKGQPAYARLKGLMNYIAYGRYEDHLDQTTTQRGLWLDHHGKPVSHESALHWARDKVHQYGYEYTYQLLLSTRYGGLMAGDFNHVLQQGSHLSGVREWRLMVHEDTGNQHAHAILLRREKLSNSLYKEWQQGMQVPQSLVQHAKDVGQICQLPGATSGCGSGAEVGYPARCPLRCGGRGEETNKGGTGLCQW